MKMSSKQLVGLEGLDRRTYYLFFFSMKELGNFRRGDLDLGTWPRALSKSEPLGSKIITLLN